MWIVFSGAGISKESGIPTFEERADLRDLLSLDVWECDPGLVWQAVWEMYHSSQRAEPNDAHRAIAQAGWFVITQNIDGLHQRAGSRNIDVLELHGDLRWSQCTHCGQQSQLMFLRQRGIPPCSCGGVFKPNVVLYQESVTRWCYVAPLLNLATGVLVVGTSLTVQPALALPGMAERRGIPVHVINRSAASEVPAFVAQRTRSSILETDHR